MTTMPAQHMHKSQSLKKTNCPYLADESDSETLFQSKTQQKISTIRKAKKSKSHHAVSHNTPNKVDIVPLKFFITGFIVLSGALMFDTGCAWNTLYNGDCVYHNKSK